MAAPTLEDMLAAINKQLGTSTPSPTPRRVTPSVAASSAALRPLQFPDRGDSGGGLPGAVLSTLAWLDKPRAAIMSTGKELTDLATGKGFSFSDWKDQVNRHYGFGEYQQEYLQGIENVALPEWVPGVGGKKMLRYVTALAGDVMTDPFILAGGLPAIWRAVGGGEKLAVTLAKMGKATGTAGTATGRVASEAAQIISLNKNNVSSGIKHLRKSTEGRDLITDLGLDAGLRWRELFTGPVLGSIGRKVMPNRIATKQAAAMPPQWRNEFAEMVGLARNAPQLDDLIIEGIQQSWRDKAITSIQKIVNVVDEAGKPTTKLVAASPGVTDFAADSLAKTIQRLGRAPVEHPFLPKWITTKPVLPGVMLNIMASPGLAAGRISAGALGRAAAKVFQDPMTASLMEVLRKPQGGDADHAALVHFGIVGSSAERLASGKHGNFTADSAFGLKKWYRSATSREGGFRRRKDDILLGQFTATPTATFEGALMEMIGQPSPAGVSHLEGVQELAAHWARQGFEVPVSTPDELWRLVELKQTWDATMAARRDSLVRIFGADSPMVRNMVRTEAMSGEHTPGIFSREGHELLTVKGADGERLNPELFVGDVDDESTWIGRQGFIDGDGQEPWVPKADPTAARFRGKVEGRFSKRRTFHGPFLDEADRAEDVLGRAGVPETALEVLQKSLTGDFSGVLRGGLKVRLGGVGPNGERLIPEGIDKMEILRRLDPSQYERQVEEKARDWLRGRLRGMEGGEEFSSSFLNDAPLDELARAANVPLEAVLDKALKDLNAADSLTFRLQRATEQDWVDKLPDGTEVTTTLSEVAARQGWTPPVSRFGWTERQQLDFVAHELGLMDPKTSMYIQKLQKREDMYIRAMGQDVHMKVFERSLAEKEIIFSSEQFYALQDAYEKFAGTMEGWMLFLNDVGPLPNGLTIDEFIRRIVGEGPPSGPPRPDGSAWFGAGGEPISLQAFIKSLPKGSQWRRVAEIYRDASTQSAVDRVNAITKELAGLEVDTPMVRRQFEEAGEAVVGALDDLARIETEIGTAQITMLGALQGVDRAMTPRAVSYANIGATMNDLFMSELRTAAPRIARHIPDLDGTLIREWDVSRWADMTERAKRVLDYLGTVRESLAKQVEKSGGEYVVGRKLTSPAEGAVRAERSVALANQRSAVAAEMGVAMDSPIPVGQRTWRRLMAFISPRERRIMDVSGDVPHATREGGAVQQVDSISAEGEILAGSKTITEIPPDEARISWGSPVIHVPSDSFAYNKGGFEFWMRSGGGPVMVLRQGEGYHWGSDYIRVGRPDNADEMIAAQYGPGAVERGSMPARRGDDISPAGRNLIKIANPHPAPHRISPTVPAPPPRAVREAAAKAPGDVEVPKKLEDAARLIISLDMASTSMIQRRLNMGFAPAGRLMSLLEHMGIVQSPSGPITRKVLVSEIPENFDALARDALVAEDVARLTAQADFEDGVRSGALQDIREPRPMSPSGMTQARFMSYARTSIEDVGAGVVVLRRSFAEAGPRDAWDDVYRAIVNPHVPLEEALADPTAGERALAEFYAAHFPNQYATGRPPGAAGGNRNYVWMGKDELFAVKVMERAATLRRIQLDAAAGVRLSADDESFLTKTMGYRSVKEALENIDDDVLVLAELGLNPFPKRRETGARMLQSSQSVETTQNPTARMVPGETADQVTALVTTAQERMQRIASRHGLDTAGGKKVTAAQSEELVDKALADVLAMGKRRRGVQSVMKEVDAEAAARVAADPNVPPAIAEVPWSERDLDVLDGVFKELHGLLEGPVAGLREDLIPLMLRLQEQKMATDETVQAAEQLFEILTEAGPTGSYIKGAQKKWKAPTVLQKYEKVIDEVKRLEDFLGVRISGQGLRRTNSGGVPLKTTKLSPMDASNPFAPLIKGAPLLDEQLRRAYAAFPPESETTFTQTLASVKSSLSRVIKGSGVDLENRLLKNPKLRAQWVALADTNAKVVELVAAQEEARLRLVSESFRSWERGAELGAMPGRVAAQTEKLAGATARRDALPAELQAKLQGVLDKTRGLRPDQAGVRPEVAPSVFSDEFDGPLPGGGMLGANAPKQLLDGDTPESVVLQMLEGAGRANIELAEIAYYVGLNEELLRILPRDVAAGVRKRLIADFADDPLITEGLQESMLEHGWLGVEARREFTKSHGPEGQLSWMYTAGKIDATSGFDPSRLPAEGFQTLIQEGASRFGANLIAMAPDAQVADRWGSTVVDVLVAAQKLTDRVQVGEYLQKYDKVHNWLKAQLVATPGFVMRNLLGGATNMWFKDISPLEIIRTGKMMQQAYKAGEGDLIIGVRLMSQKNRDSLAWMRMRDLVDSGAHAGGQAASAVDVGIVGRSRGDFFVGQKTMQKPGVRVVYDPLSPEFTPFAAVRHANTFAEEAMRLATGMHAMKVWGDSVDEAIYLIHKLHFDYGKLSDFERKNMRRAFPFYTWTRNNLPLQAEFMAKHPAKYNRLFSLKREMERNTPEEGTVPHYFLEPFGIRLPFQIMGAQIYSVPDTPFQDLLRYDPSLGGIGSTIEQFVSQSTPIVKAPVEYWAGKQVFAGIPFTERYQQVPAVMQKVPGLMNALEQIGWSKRNKRGEWKMQDNRIYLVGNLMPFMGVLQRAIPGLPGREKRKQERYISSLISTLAGLSMRMNTKYEQQSERVRREIERYLNQRDTGDIEWRTR
jgi:hypothetical protein